MITPTPRTIALLLIGAPVALVLGLMRPELWLAAPGWIAFVTTCLIIDAVSGPSAQRIALTLDAPRQIGVGEPLRLAVTARSPGRLPARADVALAVDARLAASGRINMAGTRDASDAGVLQAVAVVHPARRGTAQVTTAWLRWRGALGLVWKQRRFAVDHDIAVVPSLRAVREEGSRLFQRDALFGLRQQRRGGEGSEYEAMTEYQPGMDRRAIDWTTSARHVKLLAREYRIERDNRIVIAVDAGRTMSEPVGDMPRVDRAVEAAMLLAYVSLKMNDRVSLFHFAAQPQAMTPAYMHVRDFPEIRRAAAAIDYAPVESNFTLALATLSAQLSRRSLIVLFTEFTDATSADLMIRAAARLVKKHRLLFVVLRDVEVEEIARAEPVSAEAITRANVAASLLRDRALVIARLARMGAEVIEVPHDALGAAVVDAYLGLKRKGSL